MMYNYKIRRRHNIIDELDYLYLESKFDEDYKQIIKFIIDNNEFKKRKLYHHHEQRSVYTHSLKVSFYLYKIAKKLKMDYYSTAIGGLLHDFYYNDWQLIKRKGIKNMHGFVHAKEAYDNTIINFEFLKENKRYNYKTYFSIKY